MNAARAMVAPHIFRSWLFTSDPRRLGVLYLAAVGAFAVPVVAAGVVLRLELATPAGDLLAAPTYDALARFHDSALVWLVLLPAIPSGLGYLALPALAGVARPAFPKLALLSWYLLLSAGIEFLRRLIQAAPDAPAGEWLAAASFSLTALNLIVTLRRLRPRSPFLRALLLTGLAWFAVAASMVFLDAGIQPLIVLALVPAFGVLAEVLGDRPSVWLFGALAASSLIPTGSRLLAWAPSGAEARLVALAPLAALAPAAFLVRWLALLCVDRRSWTAAVALAGVAIALGACGAAAGMLLALRATNAHLAATQFELAYLYFLAGCIVTAALAGGFFWRPAFAGRAAPQLAGKLSAALWLISWNAALLPQCFLGYLGMPAHAHEYPAAFQWLNLISTLGALAAPAAVLAAVAALLRPAATVASSCRPATSNVNRE